MTCSSSKSVLDIKARLVVTVDLGKKWMPNSDSASNFMPEYKFLGYKGLPNSFYGYLKSPGFSRIIWTFHMKTNLGETFFPQVHFKWRSHIKIKENTAIFKQL